MRDFVVSSFGEMKEATGAAEAARAAYDSKVTLTRNNQPLAEVSAHGQISVNWAKNQTDMSPDADIWLRTPDNKVIEFETGKDLAFEITTPTGKTPSGDKNYLQFFNDDGSVAERSTAVGKIAEGASFGRNEMIWTDDKGVIHEKSQGDLKWVVSTRPVEDLR